MTTPEEPQVPLGGFRVAHALLAVAAALLVGCVAAVIGIVGANNCDAEGFACLGWLIYGLMAGVVLAAVTLIVVGRKLGLGWWFGLVTVAVAALALIPLPDWLRVVLVLLAPVVGVLVTWPRQRGPRPPTSG